MVYYYSIKLSGKGDTIDESEIYSVYMGRDKIENDPLIKHSHPKNLWFHVDNYSSAHVYLQLSKEKLASSYSSIGQLELDEDVLSQIAQLTKANSIKASKLSNITIVYTPVLNLHTDGLMDIGTVSFKNLKEVKRIHVSKKDNLVMNRINKTKTEMDTEEFIVLQQRVLRDIQRERKLIEREAEEQQRQYHAEKKNRDDPYSDLFSPQETSAYSNEYRNTNWTEDEFM